MNFHIDFPAMVRTLPVMLTGMVGGMLVMGIICVILMGLYAVGKRTKKKNPQDQT